LEWKGLTVASKASNKRYQSLPLVSIVIVNYNGMRFIEKCLASVLETDYPSFEIVLVDNASGDGSFESALRLFGKNSKVRIVRNNKNLGFAEGNNVGYQSCRGPTFGNRSLMVGEHQRMRAMRCWTLSKPSLASSQ